MLLLFIYLFNLYIRPQDWVQTFYGWPVDYIVLVPALIYGFTVAKDNKKFADIPQYKLLAIFLGIIFISNVVNGYFGFGLDVAIQFLKKMCVFIVILLIVNSTSKLKNTMFYIVLLSSFIAIQAIDQYIKGGVGFAGQGFYHPGADGGVIRTKWVGEWDGSNIMSLLLNVSVPFALEFVFGPYNIFYRIINFILAGCLIGGIYTANSRGGFMTTAIILALYPIFRLKNKKISIIIGAALAICAFVYLSPSRLGMVNTSEESAHIRTRLWSNAIEFFQEKPILGIGKERFKLENIRDLVSHSNFMGVLAEVGSLGIFVWVALNYFTFKGLFELYKLKLKKSEHILQSLTRALLVSMLGFSFCTLFITADRDIFYLIIGLGVAAINIMHRELQPVSIKFKSIDARNIIFIIAGMILFYKFLIMR